MSFRLTDDELLLTLWTYRQVGPEERFSGADPLVQWLSRTLKSLPFHLPEDRPPDEEFRSPDGLAKRVRQFQYINQGRSDLPQLYLDVWDRYASNRLALQEDAAAVLSTYGSVLPDSLDASRLDAGIKRRRSLWTDLGDQDGYDGVTAARLKDLGIDRTEAGIYRG